MANRFEIIASNTGDFFYHQIADNGSPLNLNQTCDLLNSMSTELRLLKIQPEIERLERIKSIHSKLLMCEQYDIIINDIKAFVLSTSNDLYKNILKYGYEQVEEITGKQGDKWYVYKRIADTNAVIDALRLENSALKQRLEESDYTILDLILNDTNSPSEGATVVEVEETKCYGCPLINDEMGLCSLNGKHCPKHDEYDNCTYTENCPLRNGAVVVQLKEKQ